MSEIRTFREKIIQRLQGHSTTLLVVTGPCSIYEEEETLAYAAMLKELQEELGDEIFLVMRAFVEKSRSAHDWRGFVYKRATAKEENILLGIARTKALFEKMDVPLAMEFIDPYVFYQLKEYITWGFIGARTSTSMMHRVLVSDADFPVGFKNSLDGDIIDAINGCKVASEPHCVITPTGQKNSRGNPYTHVVLRGGKAGTNYEERHVDLSLHVAKSRDLFSPILIDCSHGNCPNKPGDQKKAFKNGLLQYLKNPKKILGMMLESNIFEGASKEEKIPGVSYTDPCLSFSDTRDLLLKAKEAIISQRHKEELALPTSYEYSH